MHGRTLILVKPDAFARNLTGEIIARFERKGLRLVALQLMTMSRDLASQHYAEHEGKPFYEELVTFITSGPLVAMVLEGESAVVAARQVIGATNPLEATTGSIRGDYAVASVRTWCTAPTRRSRRPAKSGCSSPVWADPGLRADPRLAARPSGGRSSSSSGSPFDGQSPAAGARRRAAARGRPENAYRKAAAVAAGGARCAGAGGRHVVALGATVYGKPDAGRAGQPCGRSVGAGTRWSAGCA